MTLQKMNTVYMATFHGTIGESHDARIAIRKAWDSWQRILSLRKEIDDLPCEGDTEVCENCGKVGCICYETYQELKEN